MIVQLTDAGTVELLRANDFGDFQVSAPADADVDGILRGDEAGYVDASGNAQVSVEWLRRTAATNGVVETQWEEQFEAMLAYAAKKGWMPPGESTIQAHIVVM